MEKVTIRVRSSGSASPVALETNVLSGPVVAISSSANRPVATCTARIASRPNTDSAPSGLWPTSESSVRPIRTSSRPPKRAAGCGMWRVAAQAVFPVRSGCSTSFSAETARNQPFGTSWAPWRPVIHRSPPTTKFLDSIGYFSPYFETRMPVWVGGTALFGNRSRLRLR